MTIMTPTKPKYKRGDVVLVIFPHSDLRTAKLRPALIVQADNLQTELAQVIVAMISSHLHRGNHPSRVIYNLNTPAGLQSGLRTHSVIMTDNIATISDVAIERVIGHLHMEPIDRALRHTLNL